MFETLTKKKLKIILGWSFILFYVAAIVYMSFQPAGSASYMLRVLDELLPFIPTQVVVQLVVFLRKFIHIFAFFCFNHGFFLHYNRYLHS